MIATRTELPTRLLSRFHGKLSAFFAVQAGAELFARRPGLGLTLVVPGDPEAILEIRPEWCRWRKKLDTGTLAIDHLVNRNVRGDLFRRTSYRPVELGITLSPDGTRINRRSLRYGEVGQGRQDGVVDAMLQAVRQSAWGACQATTTLSNPAECSLTRPPAGFRALVDSRFVSPWMAGPAWAIVIEKLGAVVPRQSIQTQATERPSRR